MESHNNKFNIELVTPSSVVLEDSAEMVVIPGTEGEFGVLVNHAPMISTLKIGVIKTEGREQGDRDIFVAGGFIHLHSILLSQ